MIPNLPVIRGGAGFRKKIMLKQSSQADVDANESGAANVAVQKSASFLQRVRDADFWTKATLDP